MRLIDPEDGTPITIYTPNERSGGLWWGMKQAWSDISSSRYAISRLFWRDFTAQFKQRLLGYFWALIGPVMGILSFLFLYFTGVLQPGESEIPYPVYVLLGSSIWGSLAGALGAVSSGISNQADLVLRAKIPKIALAVSALSNLCYSIFVSMITTFCVFILSGITPTLFFLIYPILILPMVLLGVSIGLVLSVLGTIAKDLSSMVWQMLSIVTFITPVIYLQKTVTNPLIAKLIIYNPLTYLVDVPRSLILSGTAENIEIYFILSFIVFICVAIGVRIFYLLEDLVAERL